MSDTPQTIQTSGQLTINKSLIINGRGANHTTVQNIAPQSATSRVFFVDPTGNPTLSNLTVTGGNLSSGNQGSGILNRNRLTMIGCQISGNFITGIGSGGGVAAGLASGGDTPSTLIVSSTISRNQTLSSGGGIFNRDGNATVINSTLSGNQTGSGGGIYNINGTVNLVNSTVTANIAQICGGICADASSTVILRNSIIAQNTGTNFGPDITRLSTATVTSNGNNLIGNPTDTGNPITWQTSDVQNQNPQFAPLGFYGGTTMTHALLSSSPALNAGNNCVTNLTCASNNPTSALSTDQRGAARVGNVDIGAFEANSSANGGTFRATLPNGRLNSPYSFTLVPSPGSTSYALTGTLPPGMSLATAFAPTAAVSLTGTPTSG